MNQTKISRIAQLNDVFRSTLVGGRVMLTRGVVVLPEDEQRAVLDKVKRFQDFTADNDPHGEHDSVRLSMSVGDSSSNWIITTRP